MSELSGREALLAAFDRLFDRAARKLNLQSTPEEREEAKRSFIERYEQALSLVDQAKLPEIPESALERMEASIEELSPAHIAALIATVPLAVHVQDAMRQIAVRAAEQRLLEHLATQADTTYGGN
jgi:hypothetical protein